jgi:hypothetical protein
MVPVSSESCSLGIHAPNRRMKEGTKKMTKGTCLLSFKDAS